MVSIVGIGGTSTEGSSTERALRIALRSARDAGADVRMFGGRELVALPHYGMAGSGDEQPSVDLLSAIRSADGVIIASPGYHGSISGLVKNAIDYLEDTARDERRYLADLPVGLIVTAYGWQATGSTLGTLRAIVHALRGWPTPMGAAVKSASGLFTDEGCTDAAVAGQLELVGRQVVEFARLRQRMPQSASTGM